MAARDFKIASFSFHAQVYFLIKAELEHK